MFYKNILKYYSYFFNFYRKKIYNIYTGFIFVFIFSLVKFVLMIFAFYACALRNCGIHTLSNL